MEGEVKALHLICKRGDGLSLNNLTHDRTTGLSYSGHWDLDPRDAQALVGGWLYLHTTKTAPSEFGGVVIRFEEVKREELRRENRIVLVLRRSLHGKGQHWRGLSHGMAHSGGLVEASLPHEHALG